MADISSGTVSLKTIAVECGVSVSTASRALSVPPLGKISPAVREKIIACAKKYGYTGNPNARSLRIKKHESITLVLPPFFTQKPLYIDFDAHVRLNHWELIFSFRKHANTDTMSSWSRSRPKRIWLFWNRNFPSFTATAQSSSSRIFFNPFFRGFSRRIFLLSD